MLGAADPFYPVCKPLIKNVEDGKNVAVVSYLAILETIHALRHRIISKSAFTGDGRDECDKKRAQMEVITDKFIRTMLNLARDNKIILARPDKKISEHHYMVMKKINDDPGYVRVVSICPYCGDGRVNRNDGNKCPSCNNARESVKKYQYKGLGHADIEHAFFALYYDVPFFYSSDTSFRDLMRDPDFKTITFKIIRNPQSPS